VTAAYSANAIMIRFADCETPVQNGVFLMLKYIPNPVQSLLLYRNGLLQANGADYTISSSVISPVLPIDGDDHFVAWYRY
jgi:hypothetical protein